MDIFMWLGIGLVSGGLASRILDDQVEDSIQDILLGVIGSVFSGLLLLTFGSNSRTVDLFQVIVLLLSSTMFIWVRKSIRTR
jgi:uncharacterized membrane protein YeaQ/YmgE (transglycosylase-associated protein family)